MIMFNQNNSAINFTNATAQLPSHSFCRRFQEEEYRTSIYLATFIFIIWNILSCPAIILMNVLVILAVKTRHRLQSNHNILLACLAGTDLVVGTVTQPIVTAAEVFIVAGGSVATYCNIRKNFTNLMINFPALASILHLEALSVERYVAMKYALRYNEIVTKQRLAVAVILSWFLACVPSQFFRLLNPTSLLSFLPIVLVTFGISIIVYCHVSVYLVTRRHEKQIKTEQISEEATAKFLKEKKAWKTTSIIIGFVFLSYLPAVLYTLVSGELDYQIQYILRPYCGFSLMLNSLCNPIIYCWRSKKFRKAMIALVRRQNQQVL